MNAAGWAATPRGRTELAAVGLFCLTFAVVPLVTTELYPFSRAPMFSDAPQLYCDYEVFGPDGRRITDLATLTKLGLQRNYWGNPLGVGVGYAPPPSVDDFGRVASEEDVTAFVTRRLESFPDWAYVDVGQSIVCPFNNRLIGRTCPYPWRVNNPYYKRAGGT